MIQLISVKLIKSFLIPCNGFQIKVQEQILQMLKTLEQPPIPLEIVALHTIQLIELMRIQLP